MPDVRQGVAIFAAMSVMFLAGVAVVGGELDVAALKAGVVDRQVGADGEQPHARAGMRGGSPSHSSSRPMLPQ